MWFAVLMAIFSALYSAACSFGKGSSLIAEYNRNVVVKSLAMAPALSSVFASGIIPSDDNAPTGGFKPQIPLSSAHKIIENEVSVPTAPSTIPAATATADPLDEPEGLNLGSTA